MDQRQPIDNGGNGGIGDNSGASSRDDDPVVSDATLAALIFRDHCSRAPASGPGCQNRT